MFFKYKGFDNYGKKISGSLEALSLDDAKATLKSQKIFISSLKVVEKKEYFSWLYLFGRTMKNGDLAAISRNISIYLGSGISLANSMKLLQSSFASSKKMDLFFGQIYDSLQAGNSFYIALSSQKIYTLPQFYLESIKISEQSGILQSVLGELAIYIKEQDKFSKQITTALAYPTFILGVSFIMVGFMLSFIVPKITAIFVSSDQKLPQITQFVIALGAFFSAYFQIIVVFFVICFGIFAYLYKKNRYFRYKVDFFLLKVPFLGVLIEFSELSRFSYINSVLIRSGIPMVQSIKLGANILKNSVLLELFLVCAKKVVEGERLSRILKGKDVRYAIDKSFIQALAIGEETSSVASMFESLTILYAEQNKDKMSLFLALLEPALMLVVGIIIGTIVLAMLLPIFNMNLG